MPKRAAPPTPAPVTPAPKRTRSSVYKSGNNKSSRSLVSKVTSVAKTLITPVSRTKSRPQQDDDEDDEEEDDEDGEEFENDGADVQPGDMELDKDVEEEPAPAAKRKGKAPAKKAEKSEKRAPKPGDAFNRSFFGYLRPATDAYYNKESNLIRMRCAESHTRKSTADACIEHIKARMNFLLILCQTQSELDGRERAKYSQARADEAAAALLSVERDLKAIENQRAKYQFDMEGMRFQLDKTEKEAEQLENSAERQADKSKFDAIRKKMLGGAGPRA